MEIVIIILAVAIGILSGIAPISKNEFVRLMCVMAACVLSILLGTSIKSYVDTENRKSEITPIDVYRGNTELVISTHTSEQGDTIKCDSIVVWKH